MWPAHVTEDGNKDAPRASRRRQTAQIKERAHIAHIFECTAHLAQGGLRWAADAVGAEDAEEVVACAHGAGKGRCAPSDAKNGSALREREPF